MHWWFPGNASSVGGQVDSLFYVILYITGAVFVLVEATLLVFLVRYRRRGDRKVRPSAAGVGGACSRRNEPGRKSASRLGFRPQ